jgi:enoyl-CoA hydratase/carnithine racemase
MSAVVEYELADGIATITLNRPDELNAVNLAVCDAMRDILRTFEDDPQARVAILTGKGRVFCAGADLKAFAAGDGPKIAGHEAGFGGFVRFRRTKPVIAAINGHALAGGLELVLACDLAVASSAARFGVPEVTVGLMAGGGGAVRLPTRLATTKAAMRLLLTGQPVDAAEALRVGLVNDVVEPDEVHGAARALAEQIRASAPLAVAATLRVAHAAASGEGDEAVWRLNDELLARLFDTADAQEGPRAFAEKRRPTWAGR